MVKMKKAVGECRAVCPVIAILEGRKDAYDQANMRDGLSAAILASVPNARDLLMEGCSLGGPHKPRFSFGRLACSSEVVEDPNNSLTLHSEPQAHYSEEGLDQAALGMSFGTRII